MPSPSLYHSPVHSPLPSPSLSPPLPFPRCTLLLLPLPSLYFPLLSSIPEQFPHPSTIIIPFCQAETAPPSISYRFTLPHLTTRYYFQCRLLNDGDYGYDVSSIKKWGERFNPAHFNSHSHPYSGFMMYSHATTSIHHTTLYYATHDNTLHYTPLLDLFFSWTVSCTGFMMFFSFSSLIMKLHSFVSSFVI